MLPVATRTRPGDSQAPGPYSGKAHRVIQTAELRVYPLSGRGDEMASRIQTSGRSDPSWEGSARLDLRYVENWSFALDMLILWKPISALL